MKKLLLAVTVAICAGCGSGGAAQTTTNGRVTDENVGKFIKSEKTAQGWIATCEGGVFNTYTSMNTSYNGNITLETTRGREGDDNVIVIRILIDDKKWWYVKL